MWNWPTKHNKSTTDGNERCEAIKLMAAQQRFQPLAKLSPDSKLKSRETPCNHSWEYGFRTKLNHLKPSNFVETQVWSLPCGQKRRPAAHLWSYHRVHSKGTFGPKLKYVEIISNHNSEPAKNGRRSKWLEMSSQNFNIVSDTYRHMQICPVFLAPRQPAKVLVVQVYG